MHKDQIERICRTAGMKPEKRQAFGEYEIFVADGFSLPPHNAYRRFGVEADEFPGGMYATLWFVSKGEKLDTGQPLFFDVRHNPEYDPSTKKIARINRAIKEASGFIQRRKRAH